MPGLRDDAAARVLRELRGHLLPHVPDRGQGARRPPTVEVAEVTLPVKPPVKPMLAKLSRELPVGDDFVYEPKWDGFRCIVFRDGDDIELGSRNERPLTRYFPDVVDAVKESLPSRCVVDGEIVIARDGRLDFEALQLRLHPAESRVRKLAAETP